MVLQVRAGERTPALLRDDVIPRLAVEIWKQFCPVEGQLADSAPLICATRRHTRHIDEYDGQLMTTKGAGQLDGIAHHVPDRVCRREPGSGGLQVDHDECGSWIKGGYGHAGYFVG
jgi:hypothetical protein